MEAGPRLARAAWFHAVTSALLVLASCSGAPGDRGPGTAAGSAGSAGGDSAGRGGGGGGGEGGGGGGGGEATAGTSGSGAQTVDGGGGAAGSSTQGDGGAGGGGPGGGGAGGGAGGGGAGGTQGGGGRGGGGGAAGTGGSAGAPGTDAGGADRPDASDGAARPARVLLYSFSTLDIPSVAAQLSIFKQKLEGWQYQVDQSKDPAVFTDANLARYAAVGMINTCFYPFGANNQGAAESQALQRFLQAGGGLFGTHCADVTFQSVNPPPLYNQLIGGRANSDNFTGDNACRKMGDHPTIAALPDTFKYNGNLDNAAFVATDSVVLVKCKFGGGSGADTAVSWVRNEGPGRVFFTGFGKVDKDLTDATIGDKHLVAGLGWVLGR